MALNRGKAKSALLSLVLAAGLCMAGAVKAQASTVYQINCGGGGTGTWVYDRYYTGGTALGTSNSINTSTVTNPAPMAVYQHERSGAFTYTLPSLTAGAAYTVRLHFCEFEYSASGKRQFNVLINGTQVLTNFDVFAAAGGEYIANIQQFNATANGSGNIVIQWTNGNAGAPQITGIELLTGGSGSAPSAPTNLSASASGSSQINLAWTASTTSGVTYNVYRGTSAGGESGTPVASGLTSTSYSNTGLSASTTYYYKVAAVNGSGTSPLSNEASATTNSSSSGLARACWVWNASTIVTSSSQTSALFSFLAAPKGVSSHAITMICCAFSLSQLTDGTVGPEIRNFITTAHNQGIRVYFVCGDPTWATTNEATALQWLNGVLSFNASGSPKFDGFQYDVEPYTLSGWPSSSMENGWVTLMSDSESTIASSGQSITLSATMPFWLHSSAYNYCDEGIINNTNETSIMDYVTTVANLENYPAGEVSYANSVGKKAWIAVETNGPASSSTFYGLGNAAMENVFSGAQSYYQGQSCFAGYQIDDYTGYVNLGP